MQRFIVSAGSALEGVTAVPGDKSISHRAVMLGSIARGQTTVRGFLNGADCLATLDAFRAMGVEIERNGEDGLRISGVGHGGLRPPEAPVDLGNSGTSCRLLAGLLAGQRCPATLTGDSSLRSRPMERVAAPLRAMGAMIATTAGCAPLSIGAGGRLVGIEHHLPVASAQIKSALLLAGLGADGSTIVRSPALSRDHTERMLRAMGAPVTLADAGLTVRIDGPCELEAIAVEVPGDLSSAAFVIVAALLGATRPVEIRNVGVNPTRDGVLRILEAMGANVMRVNARTLGDEPVADIVVARSDLHGIEIPPEWVPLAIDEFPAICVAAAAASGTTIVSGADELRHKESDRIAAMVESLNAVGIHAVDTGDGLTVEGGKLLGGSVDSRGDHRIAMAMSAAAAVSEGPVEILDTENVGTSFPGFAATMRSLGLEIEVLQSQADWA